MTDDIATEPDARKPDQLSLFGADVVPARPMDLEGLLAGPGQVVRMGGTARISVVVDDAWRARTLLAEFARRGLAATGERTSAAAGAAAPDEAGGSVPTGQPGGAGTGEAAVAGRIGVRTAFSASLAPIAARWLRGALTKPPEDFDFNGHMLRMWYIAAGQAHGPQQPGRSGALPSSRAVTLRLSATDQSAWPPVGAALRRSGLEAELIGSRGGGPAYRIVGTRRIAGFLELIGSRPESVPEPAWPRMLSRRRDRAVSAPASTGSGVRTGNGSGVPAGDGVRTVNAM